MSKGESLEIFVDDEDFEWLQKLTISVTNNGIGRKSLYFTIMVNGKKEYIHRTIMKKYNDIEGFEIDHKDRNTFNNQKSNLRIVTHRQNSINCGPQKNNTTGYKGVTRMRKNFQAVLNIEDRGKVYMGTYSDVRDAAIAYDIAVKEEYGEFAYLNFPEATDEEILRVKNLITKSKKNNRTSSYRGISRRKGYKKWIAQIKKESKMEHIGVFDTEFEAVEAYNKRAIELNLPIHELPVT